MVIHWKSKGCNIQVLYEVFERCWSNFMINLEDYNYEGSIYCRALALVLSSLPIAKLIKLAIKFPFMQMIGYGNIIYIDVITFFFFFLIFVMVNHCKLDFTHPKEN